MLKKKNYGLYTAKTKGNDYACDSFGKPYTFINSAAPYPDTKKETNPKWQGKQIITGSKVNREATELGKQFAQAIAYAPEPYIEDPKVEKVRKMGFGSVSKSCTHYSPCPVSLFNVGLCKTLTANTSSSSTAFTDSFFFILSRTLSPPPPSHFLPIAEQGDEPGRLEQHDTGAALPAPLGV